MRRVPGEEVHQQFSLPIPGSVSPAPGDLSMLGFTPSDSFNPFGQSENCVNSSAFEGRKLAVNGDVR